MEIHKLIFSRHMPTIRTYMFRRCIGIMHSPCARRIKFTLAPSRIHAIVTHVFAHPYFTLLQFHILVYLTVTRIRHCFCIKALNFTIDTLGLIKPVKERLSFTVLVTNGQKFLFRCGGPRLNGSSSTYKQGILVSHGFS